MARFTWADRDLWGSETMAERKGFEPVELKK